MPLPKFLAGIVSGGAGNLIEKIGNVADNLFTSKEEVAQFKQAMVNEINRHAEKQAELALAETELYLKDVDSARQMQIAALSQQDRFSKRFVYYLASGIILLTFTFDLLLFFVSYPERNHDIINMTAGVINSMGFGAVVSFFFGSTKNSEKKTDALEKMAVTKDNLS